MLCFGRPNLVQGLTLHRTQALLGRLELCGRYRTDACHHSAGARMTCPSEGAKALNGGCHERIHDHILHELFPGADLTGDHDLRAAKVTQNYVLTERYLPLLICCGFCSATGTRRSSDLPLLGAAS